ncbi:MAG: DUF3656 domain-containing protein [Huintestinicola sp.]
MGKDMQIKKEILAPAGSMESIYAAVRCGADAVYVGGKNFSARANAVNFSDEELKAAADYCHLCGVKIYRAMNTVIFDSEAEEFLRDVRYSAEIGIDGLIIQDLGGIKMAREAVPDMPLHASTQMTLHTYEGALFARSAGLCRIVPARELDMGQIEKVCSAGVETEVFAHGALCMCVSGQCYMSAMIGSRSANRGQCAQACRLPFSAFGRADESAHALSLKDMSYLYSIDELSKAGAASFKIEGRMKRAEYTAAAVTALKAAADGADKNTLDRENERLRAVFSRSGFTDGYLTGKLGSDMFGIRRKDDVTAAEDVLPELGELFRREKKRYSIDLRCIIKRGEPARLEFSCGGVSGYVCGDSPEEARNRPTGYEDVEKQLSKLGDTVYTLGSLSCNIDEGVIMPASKLNQLRRECTALADRMITQKNTPKYHILPVKAHNYAGKKSVSPKLPELRLMTDRAEAVFADMESPLFGGYILPMEICEKEYARLPLDKVFVKMPRFMNDEEDIIRRTERLCSLGFKHIYCTNYAHLRIGGRSGMHCHGGTGLNITNSAAADCLSELGAEDIVLSPEMKASQISKTASPVPKGIYAYGNMPLMLTRNCPVKAASGSCGKCSGRLTDRTGREFAVKCSRGFGYTEILNCDTLCVSDSLGDFGKLDFIVIDTGAADKAEVNDIAEAFLGGRKPSLDRKLTRGLYYRGVGEK